MRSVSMSSTSSLGAAGVSLKATCPTGTIGGLTLVSRVLGLVRDSLFARYIGASFASDAFLVRGDPVQLQQVVLNLVANGIDAVREASLCRAIDEVLQAFDADPRHEPLKARFRALERERLARLRHTPALTLDGQKVELLKDMTTFKKGINQLLW